MKRILVMVNHPSNVYNFRREIIDALLEQNYMVGICCPPGKELDYFLKKGCQFFDSSVKGRGKNVLDEIKVLLDYKHTIDQFRPDIVLGYTIKPNLYGGILSRYQRFSFIANITGLGIAVEETSVLQKLIMCLYRFALKRVGTVFFQNQENMRLFEEKRIVMDNYALLPGSGVNMERFPYLAYPKSKPIKFLFAARILKEKGIEHYLEAAKAIKKINPEVEFHVCGLCEYDYEHKIAIHEHMGIIHYHGLVKDISSLLQDVHCMILPSYHEGMSNSLLEAAASGRPIIASAIPGCLETFDEGISGFGFLKGDTQDLIKVIEQFLNLSLEEMETMGKNGHEKMKRDFNRKVIVEKYLERVQELSQ